MSFESFALQKLFQRHPTARKNGLPTRLRELGCPWSDVDFIPDATDVEDDVLFIYEVEDTSSLTMLKLDRISFFAHDLYDETGIYTELHVLDRYGLNERKVYDVRDEIMWFHGDPDLGPCDWISETEINKRDSVPNS